MRLVRSFPALAIASLLAMGLGCPRGPSTAPPQGDQPSSVHTGFENPGGMWMPGQMVQHAEALRDLGVEFDPAALADPTAFPLGAVVSLGGCSGAFVSEQGLVITNHHCVIDALQQNSTRAENLLQEGFLASSLQQERPAGPSARVYVTRAFTEVTDQVVGGLELLDDAGKRYAELQRRVETLENECEAKATHLRCSVVDYFEGAQFFRIEQLELRDVRLVYAPHAGTGVFGGEADNWRWPRHTGDYAFLRAYIGPDGEAADYARDNVPYRPEHHLEVTDEALRPGDFVMVAGYPGRTFRFKAAAEVAEAVRWDYPHRIARLEAAIETLQAIADRDPELAIKTASRLRHYHNGLTNARGMLDGLVQGGLLDRKESLESELASWIADDPKRKAQWGDVLPRIDALLQQRREHREHDAAIQEIVASSQLLEMGQAVWTEARARQKHESDATSVGRATRVVEDAARTYAPQIEIAMLTLAFDRALALPPQQRPTALIEAFVGPDLAAGGDRDAIAARLQEMVASTALADPAERRRLIEQGTPRRLERNQDPFLKVARHVEGLVGEAARRREAYEGELAVLKPRYVAALRAYDARPVAPDANGTLRVTFGTIRGYRPKPDAPMHPPFTTLQELVAKHTGKPPYVAPQNVLGAAQRAASTRYVDPRLKDVPVDFLADLDITGGNSGSATLNARGELIGLAFDGNYESIASDWVFMPEVTRSIHVDIRYVLWLMDHVDGAHRLMREMGIEPEAVGPSSTADPSGRWPARNKG